MGRRLGYPFKLANTLHHCFNRWADPATGECFNLEDSCLAGDDSPSDEHYGAKWRFSVSDADILKYDWLRTLTPKQELARFVRDRGVQWIQAKQFAKAAECFNIAVELHPESHGDQNALRYLAYKWRQHLIETRRPGGPVVRVNWNGERHWPRLPYDLEKHFHKRNAVDGMMNDESHNRLLWQPMREERPPLARVPKPVTYTPRRK